MHCIFFLTWHNYPDYSVLCLLICAGAEENNAGEKIRWKGRRPTIQNCYHGSKNIQMGAIDSLLLLVCVLFDAKVCQNRAQLGLYMT